MNKYLSNLALIYLTNKATELNIHPDEGSKLYKYPRKQMYSLLNAKTGRTFLTVTFYTNQTPYFFIQPTNNKS